MSLRNDDLFVVQQGDVIYNLTAEKLAEFINSDIKNDIDNLADALVFRGVVDATSEQPPSLRVGDVYANTATGSALDEWTGLTNVAEGDLLGLGENVWVIIGKTDVTVSYPVTSVNGETGDVTLALSDITNVGNDSVVDIKAPGFICDDSTSYFKKNVTVQYDGHYTNELYAKTIKSEGLAGVESIEVRTWGSINGQWELSQTQVELYQLVVTEGGLNYGLNGQVIDVTLDLDDKGESITFNAGTITLDAGGSVFTLTDNNPGSSLAMTSDFMSSEQEECNNLLAPSCWNRSWGVCP